jgi:fluoroacetyl-CoA thioesterase
MRDTLRPGLAATLTYQVAEDRTVSHLLPESAEFADMPQVLATGYLVGLVEWTCIRAIGGHLDDSERTVGIHIDLSHDAPTPPNRTVTIDVELTAVEGRTLTFAVHGRDDAADICRGTHRRAVIHLARFEARAWGR